MRRLVRPPFVCVLFVAVEVGEGGMGTWNNLLARPEVSVDQLPLAVVYLFSHHALYAFECFSAFGQEGWEVVDGGQKPPESEVEL